MDINIFQLLFTSTIYYLRISVSFVARVGSCYQTYLLVRIPVFCEEIIKQIHLFMWDVNISLGCMSFMKTIKLHLLK